MAPQQGQSSLPDRVEAVLLDAGGVLLDLDYGYLRRLVETRRNQVSIDDLARYEAQARHEVHRQYAGGGRVSEAWRDYFHIILSKAGISVEDREEIIDSLWEANQRFGLWTVPIEGGPETVAELKRRGFRTGVVSNAEGRVEQDLDAAGYGGLLETVVDSHVVGVEKPDPEIFRIAMEIMKVAPERTIYVGDLPAVDVAGALAAGMSPILLDKHDLFTDTPARRIRSITDLLELLPPAS
jgi:putative hydrolase of the HAD superfamily